MHAAHEMIATMSGRAHAGDPWMTSTELAESLPVSWATVKRRLDDLMLAGLVIRDGRSRGTRYRIAPGARIPDAFSVKSYGSRVREPLYAAQPEVPFFEKHEALRARLSRPLLSRERVTYDRSFVDAYVPNESCLLPVTLAKELGERGRMKDQAPAGTYARKVLEPLLIDLSWSSSRLEGNRYSMLETARLFKNGDPGDDYDATMLLNHKKAIEFLVDSVPFYGLNAAIIGNLHAYLMQNLLANAGGLGNVRRQVVGIGGTTYMPLQLPQIIDEMFALIVSKACEIRSPIEAAFFLWVNIPYLQPYEDGNKRTSRLVANIPLLVHNCAPLSFLDVDPNEYALAMIAVYECRDVSLAVDVFADAYGRSIAKYAEVLEVMGVPDPIRAYFRETLNVAIGSVVRDRVTAAEAVALLSLTSDREKLFVPILEDELRVLNLFNCARYRLTFKQMEQWISDGRPC